ncbi:MULTISPECIES: class I SAM-dependent DNA methyltransferase [Pediococcus]|uniref:class I SAM-dependent DNA methyltransferase n=1 Tax=Pediococcus TaxID=1253 RepID=UPI000C06BCC0|nr:MULTISPECIES: class I SAM-dependent methyltransferase [Pediococcus]AVL01340.1 SAM-dependent methyltransferase [Pediococcus pentosaceus]KAF5440807.1 class I SAM-dependent methyltransferase [Pediococcus sp. EKM202D]KAF5441630.1 class I SAM-dependent methyltransferase [Pediococcus sp. EKM201D]MBF7133724.1 class I SAM-dependent methyltransferase [Pediococcus pentosaceus]MDQ7252154.1 class I SAM-dependent methyltransferase [Pediococcus pentosaceus]
MIYQSFAELYDQLFDEDEYQNWFEYTQKEVDLSRKNNWLELACGAGRLVVQLAQHGQIVTGFDLSEEMLALAEQHTRDAEVAAELIQGNMLDLSELEQFDVVSCYADSFCYLPDEEQVLQSFSEVYEHLKSGGQFIFDVITPYQTGVVYPGYMFNYQDDRQAFIWSSFEGEDKYHVEHDLTFFTKANDDELFRRTEETHFERTYELETYVKLLEKAGFSKIKYYADYGKAEVDEKTTRWFFSCRR